MTGQLDFADLWDRLQAEGICFVGMTSPVPGVREHYEAWVSTGPQATYGDKLASPVDAIASAFENHTGKPLFPEDFEDLLGDLI